MGTYMLSDFTDFHAVNTRCIHMTKAHNSTKGDNIALAPMLDFLNHTTEARVIAIE